MRKKLIVAMVLATATPALAWEEVLIGGPPPVNWFAIAVGTTKDGSGVSTSLSGEYTKHGAESSALAACYREHRLLRCSVVKAWSKGCGFIATDVGPSRVCWGIGETHQSALAECRQKGCACTRRPQGECL